MILTVQFVENYFPILSS